MKPFPSLLHQASLLSVTLRNSKSKLKTVKRGDPVVCNGTVLRHVNANVVSILKKHCFEYRDSQTSQGYGSRQVIQTSCSVLAVRTQWARTKLNLDTA